MNPAQVIGVLICLGVILFGVLIFEVGIFRVACIVCRVPQPGWFKTVGLVILLLFVPAVVDAVISAILIEVYRATRYPLWEAGIVQFFIALPVHMGICGVIHAKIVGVRVGQAFGVWLVEKVLKLSIVAAIAGVVAVFVLASRANG